MKKKIKKIIPNSVKLKIISLKELKQINELYKQDRKSFLKYSFGAIDNINSYEQLEARITKEYHSIEKGLSYEKIRLGFGVSVIKNLVRLMAIYKEKGYSLDAHFYLTALSNLNEYITMHEENNYDVSDLKELIGKVANKEANLDGGVWYKRKEDVLKSTQSNFMEFSLARHSVRDFSDEPVDVELIKDAIKLAQSTPSACNRQSWKIRIIATNELKKKIRENQNGNRGFGQKIDKFLLITTDNQSFSKPRERNQAHIDGGMHSMNLLYSLHYKGLATIPLSASLTIEQEKNLRSDLKISESENFIMFIGVGHYVDGYKVPKSTRRNPNIIVM